jgi:hypothetical protein
MREDQATCVATGMRRCSRPHRHNHFTCLRRVARCESGPGLHQPSPLFEELTAPAILKVVRTNLKQFGELEDWEKAALNNASKFLDGSAAWA